MPIRDAEKRREYHRRYMKKRRAGGDVKPEKEEKSIKVKKLPFDLNTPATEVFRALGIPEISKRDGKLLEGITP